MNTPIQNPISKAEPRCGFSFGGAATRRGAWLFVTLALLAPFAGNIVADPMGTAFSYQGLLADGTNAANGVYDLQFTLYDALTNGSVIGQPVTNTAVTVSSGLFTVWLDFGPHAYNSDFAPPVFDGDARWLELAVRTNSPNDLPLTVLSPRQRVPLMPYALYASLAGDIKGAQPALWLSTNVAFLSLGRPATGSVTVETLEYQGMITHAQVTDGGLGYTTTPLVTINDPNGSGAEITATVTNNSQVVGLTVVKNGTGYTKNATLTIGPPQFETQTFSGTNFFTSDNTFLQGMNLTNNWNVSVGSFQDPTGWNHLNSLLFSKQGVVQAGIDPTDGFEVLSNLTVTGTLHAGNGADIQHDLQVDGNLSVGGSNGVALTNNWSISVGSFQDPTGANHVNSLLFSQQGAALALMDPAFGLGVAGQLATASHFHCGGSSTVDGDSFVFGDFHLSGNAYVVGFVAAKSFNQQSDRNFKENFGAVSPREVLDKVATLPITRWNFKDDPATPHMGAMAQDFYAAFQVGRDDQHIATVDADGVALAAIQGLNQKLEADAKAKDAEIQTLKRQNDSLVERLNQLEATVKSLAERK